MLLLMLLLLFSLKLKSFGKGGIVNLYTKLSSIISERKLVFVQWPEKKYVLYIHKINNIILLLLQHFNVKIKYVPFN